LLSCFVLLRQERMIVWGRFSPIIVGIRDVTNKSTVTRVVEMNLIPMYNCRSVV
jgi:hypothetical protein